jgi:hypothetical protein
MAEIFLILGLIVVLTIFIVWPKLSLYTLAFLAPVIGWSLYWKNLILTPIDLIAVLAALAFCLRLISQSLFKVKNPIKLKWPLWLPFLIFLAINCLSAFFSVDPSYSFWYIARWLLLLYVGYILVPYNLIDSGKTLKKTIIALVLSASIVLISGLLSLYGQDWSDSFFRIRSLSILGVYPFGENHNLIAEFLNVGVFLVLVLRELAKSEKSKKIWDIVAILMAGGVILTFSRTGWITLILQVILYFGYRLRNKIKFSSFVFATLGILLILSPLLWKMYQLQQENTSSTENRWLLTEIAWKNLQDKPYFGAGSGQFVNLVADNVRFTAKYGAPLDSHGVLQKVAAENGAFGLAAWLFLLAYLFNIARKALKKYYHNHPWILPLFLAGAGGLFFQFFNTSYYKGKVWLPIAIALAAIRLLEKKYESKDERKN